MAYKLQSYNFVIQLPLELSEQPWSTASAVKLMLLFVSLRIIFPKISLIISICHHFSKAFSCQKLSQTWGCNFKAQGNTENCYYQKVRQSCAIYSLISKLTTKIDCCSSNQRHINMEDSGKGCPIDREEIEKHFLKANEQWKKKGVF